MEFSGYFKESLNEAWYEHYLQYDTLVQVVDQIENAPTESLEKSFIELIRSEYKKCNAFYNIKIQELKEELVESDDIKYIMHEITDLYQFGILNRIGFYKILKWHDKVSSIPCLNYYSVKLSNDLFCPVEKIYLMFVLFSKKHREVREKILASSSSFSRYSYLETTPPTPEYEQLVAGTLQQGLQEDNFVRKSMKFWIFPKDLPKIIATITKKLPMHLFNDDELIQETTSIYLDNEHLDCFHNRIGKQEGADLIRLRWYGELKNLTKVFVEQKVHHEGWSEEVSSKNRFLLDKDLVYDFLAQKEYLVNSELSGNDLVDKVKYSIDQKKLRPSLATRYLRFAFQDEDNDYIRISIDMNLRMIKKNGDLNDWDSCETAMKSNSIHFFPYAVMEVKLRAPFIEHRPEWLNQLLEKKEVIPAVGFSKYQHGCSLLHSDRTEVVPYWIKENSFFSSSEGIESLNRIRRVSSLLSGNINKPLPRVRLDPKIMLAIERNFYHWISMTFMLLRMVLGRRISWCYRLIALFSGLWAICNGIYLFWARRSQMLRGEISNYQDLYGLSGVALSALTIVVSELIEVLYYEF